MNDLLSQVSLYAAFEVACEVLTVSKFLEPRDDPSSPHGSPRTIDEAGLFEPDDIESDIQKELESMKSPPASERLFTFVKLDIPCGWWPKHHAWFLIKRLEFD